ncbi:hypothetical protein ABZT04_41870 [Streptomyces sp. NPDC005492]|uniref:hypothetical protein n=1 Tax=Streptomyces sp. NPDC005492 TaxID=3156883 RepID=UPI0033A438AD
MTSRAKVPDDGEAMRVRVRELIQKAYHRGALGHEVRAKLDKGVSKEDNTPAVDVEPPVPDQRKPPCGDGPDEDESVRAEVLRQKELVGELAGYAHSRARRLRVSRAARQDIAQDAITKALHRIEGAPLVLDERPEHARYQIMRFLRQAVIYAYQDHYRKIAARAVTLAEYTEDIELPRTIEGGESAESAFFAEADKSMAEALTEGFASSMDDAIREAERLATAMHNLVGTKELLSLILHSAFAVPADVVAEMTGSSTASVRMAVGAAKPKLKKPTAKRTFLMRLNRVDAD